MEHPKAERATEHRPEGPTATLSPRRLREGNRMPGRPRALLANRSFAPALLCACVALGAFLSVTPSGH